MKRIAISLGIAAYLLLVGIDAFPSTCLAHTRLKEAIDPFMDASGLWQSWSFYAPEPDNINTRLSATIEFNDGTRTEWNSPNIGELSAWQKMASFRGLEYYDSIRLDKNRSAWESFAQYLAQQHESQTKKVVKVDLIRHWSTIPPPKDEDTLWPIGGRRDGFRRHKFYEWTPNG